MKNKIKNRRVIIIKKLPASYIEEAIVILRDNEEKSIEKELINSVKDKNIVENRIKEEDLNILKDIPKENRKYIIKEAERIVLNYIDKIEENFNFKRNKKILRCNKILKYLNLCLIIVSIISIIIGLKI